MGQDVPDNMIAMMEPLIEMAKESVKNINPENVVAQFIQENLPALIKLDANVPLVEMSNEIITKMHVEKANTDVQSSLKALLTFYENFRIFYKELLEKTNKEPVTAEEPEEEKPDTESEPEAESESEDESKAEDEPEDKEEEAPDEDEEKWRKEHT